MEKFVKVAEKKDLSPGQATVVAVDGKKIALFNIDNEFYALDDECTHASGPLSEGALEGTVVTCPWHGATFEVTTGEALGAPAFEGVKKYNVQVEGNDIKIQI